MKTNRRMRRLVIGLSLALGAVAAVPMAAVAAPTGAMNMNMDKTVMVGGAAMLPSRNIVQNAMNSKDHTTLVAAVKAAGLVDTLSSQGPFTVFAPTNEAFAALPAGTVDNLLKPENKATLVKILTYHVVPGKMTAHDLSQAVTAGGGKAMLKTVEGDSITVSKDGDAWTVTDEKGNVANISIADVMQSNGVIFVIDKVLMP
ncbi:MAG: fasciclin domain-containing protein [Rhodanobacter sp.]